MVLYQTMKPIEHVLHHLIKLSLYYWTHWSCWWVYHFKKHRYHAIFHNNLIDTEID